MINNNPYNIPEKKPLSQSKILSDTNTNSSRHSSAYFQNRNNNEIMYSSSIFLKNSTINGHSDQSFFEPIKQPMSPHHSKYPKPMNNVQFVPSYNHHPIRLQEPNFAPVSIPKQINLEKGLQQLRQKVENIQKRLETRQRKESSLNQSHNRKLQVLSQSQSSKALADDNLNNSNMLRQLINSAVQATFEAQSKKIWQKLKDLDDNMAFSSNQSFVQKISNLEESFVRLQTDKPQHIDEHLHNRLKTIQKTIREMGEDIHLVNDKEQSLSVKLENELPFIRNEIKNLKTVDKRLGQSEKKNEILQNQIEQLSKRIKSFETSAELSLTNKIKEIESKLQSLKSPYKDVKPSYDRYFSEPIVLKYIQRFQVSKQHSHQYSYSNSTKDQSCEEIVINQITYYIDYDGYLLDNDRYYLTNGIKNERIRLDKKHIEILKQKKILI